MDQKYFKIILMIFAREPVLGKVKTRLQKDVSLVIVLKLYQSFIRDVLAVAREVTCGRKVIYYTGSRDIPFLKRFKKYFDFSRQAGGDLGQRMSSAFFAQKRKGFEKILIIGTDCLSLTSSDIKRAFDKLTDYDVVLGPSRDGGYYLIGLKEPNIEFFKGIQWGGESVQQKTLKRIHKAKKTVFLLRKQSDIDDLKDLKRFFVNFMKTGSNKHTVEVIKSYKIFR